MSLRLSILIPTYNRAEHLARLIRQILDELASVERACVEVLIADNCSTDLTPLVIEELTAGRDCFVCFRHESNIGPDENFAFLVHQSKAQFFWMIGDDDLPRTGLLPLLLSYIESANVSLIYLSGLFADSIHPGLLPPLAYLAVEELESPAVARIVSGYITFISSWVVRREALPRAGVTSSCINELSGSYLIQLSWILPILAHFPIVGVVRKDPVVICTSENFGGCNLLDTLILRLPSLVSRLLEDRVHLRRALLSAISKYWLPSVVILARLYSSPSRSRSGWSYLRARVWYSYPAFWFLCLPALVLPRPICRVVVLATRSLRGSVIRLNAFFGTLAARLLPA